MKTRNTIQRAMTLAAVTELGCHATADEIYSSVAKKHPGISKATVYRNLNELAESGKILKVEIPNGADRFDHQTHRHYHMKCLSCGRVFDADIPYLPDLTASVNRPDGFEITGYTLLFHGYCSDCKTHTIS